MDLKEFGNRLENLQHDIDRDIPRIIGTEAVNHFQQSFQNEGFTDTSLLRWQEVKRRLPGSKARGADRTRKILTGRTGMLHDSIDFKVSANKVMVYANPMNQGAGHNYAEAHNFGTSNAGRSRTVVIPKRQFLGKSKALMSNINDRITRYFETLINKFL